LGAPLRIEEALKEVSGCLGSLGQVCGSEVKEGFLGQAGDRVWEHKARALGLKTNYVPDRI
jgi:hypothetical protein